VTLSTFRTTESAWFPIVSDTCGQFREQFG